MQTRIYICAEDGTLKEKPGVLLPEDSAARLRAGRGWNNLNMYTK
jgi:hypothetical protein